MNFSDSEIYLNSLGNEVLAMKLGLDNIRTLLAALGNPEENYLKVQVAGTNGKGSVCAFLDSICREAGIAVGVFTSPHLVSITERVRINGLDMSEDEFARIATIVRDRSEKLVAQGKLETVPTFFEQVTAIALVAFAEAKVELAILETGLGGRYDAVTAANAEIAAITRIDLDHQEYLGDTIEQIAAEKAAIIGDEFKDIVLGAQPEAALKVMMERCNQLGTEPVNDQYESWTVTAADDESVRVETTRYIFPKVVLGLKGRHQIENAETAILIVAALKYGGYPFDIDDEHIVPGLENARHPGRLEFQGRYLFDGAHNIGGAKALRDYLDKFHHWTITMIFGAMKDKEVAEIAGILFPAVENIILTRPGNARAMSANDIAAASEGLVEPDRFVLTDNVADALAKADEIAGHDSIILITGSLYLVGEAKRILRSQI